MIHRWMTRRGRTRVTAWATMAILTGAVHLGTMFVDRGDPASADGATVARHAAPADAGAAVECIHGADEAARTCVLDLAALEAERMPFPRGLRLLPEGGGMRLDGARGLATRVGLRNGDVLLAIDDHRLRDGADLEVMGPAVARGGFTLRFRRDDRIHALGIMIVARG